MTALSLNAQGFVDWPTRDCASWCTAAPHEDQHPEDRSCWSAFERQDLTRRKPLDYGGHGWGVDHLDVVLRRRPNELDPIVVINDETNSSEIELTVDEARQLSAALLRLLEVASS